MQLRHGSYEVNPPFVPSILTATAQHLLQQLQAAEAAAGALSFVVLMPGWEEVKGWQLLNNSCFLRQSVLVAAADHGEMSEWIICSLPALPVLPAPHLTSPVQVNGHIPLFFADCNT